MQKKQKAVNNVDGVTANINKKHRATATQRQSFKELNESGKRETQAHRVYIFMQGKPPMTSRLLSALTGFERSSINRIINDLKDAGRAKVAHCAKCPTTGKTVEHYAIIQTTDGEAAAL